LAPDSQDTRSENSSQDVAGWIGQDQEWRRPGKVNRIGYKGKRSPSADSGGQMETSGGDEVTIMGLWRVEKIIGGDGVGVDGTEVVVGEGKMVLGVERASTWANTSSVDDGMMESRSRDEYLSVWFGRGVTAFSAGIIRWSVNSGDWLGRVRKWV